MGSAQWHYNIGIFSFRFHRFTPHSTKTFGQDQSQLELTNIPRSTASFRQQRKHICAENFLHSPRNIFNIHSAHRKKYLKFNLWRGESAPLKIFLSADCAFCRPIISISQRATGNASYNIRIKQIEKKRAAIRRAFGIFHNSNSTLFSNSELEVLRQQARAISPFQASHACIFENEGSLYALCRPPHWRKFRVS